MVSVGFCCFYPFLAHESAVRDGSSLPVPARKAWKLQVTHGWVLGSSEAGSLVCGVQCWPPTRDLHGTLSARLLPLDFLSAQSSRPDVRGATWTGTALLGSGPGGHFHQTLHAETVAKSTPLGPRGRDGEECQHPSTRVAVTWNQLWGHLRGIPASRRKPLWESVRPPQSGRPP